MDLINKFRNIIIQEASTLTNASADKLNQITLNTPKHSGQGELTTTAALNLVAYSSYTSARALAEAFRERLLAYREIERIEVAGPGFLNLTLVPQVWQQVITTILDAEHSYGQVNIGQGQAINIEYVSANPTGPIHIGHLRGAIVGDVLARLFAYYGFAVTKEFYVNDAGNQITKLGETVYLRYQEVVTGQPIVIPEGLYPGSYLIPVAQQLYQLYGDQLMQLERQEWFPLVKQFAVAAMLDLIKEDLNLLGIQHDIFLSEDSLNQSGAIRAVVETLKKQGRIYEGILPPPKGIESENWEAQKQLLLRCTEFGDDQDRTIMRADGTFTYAAGELAYALDKINRGYDQMIIVLGGDHTGYVKRLQATFQALNSNDFKIVMYSLVNYFEGGQMIKMSKRAGTFTTIKDVLNVLDKDILRFMMLTRKNDTILDLDINLAKEHSKDNPVFYVQYAHVRATSAINNAHLQQPLAYEIFAARRADLKLINTDIEKSLLILLALWPKVLEEALNTYEPYRIAFYLQDLAGLFHHLWTAIDGDQNYRFITNDIPRTAARISLALAVKTVLANGLTLTGVTPLEHM